MFISRQFYKITYSAFFTVTRNHQVAIVGATNEVGQTTALLLRTCPSVSKLVLHDTTDSTPGIVLDLSHIPSKSKAKGYCGSNTLEEALQGSSLVLAVGGLPQKSLPTSQSVLSQNADFIKIVSSAVTRIAPVPFFGIVTEPINTLVPMAAEVMRHQGCYEQNKLFGVTIIDALKAQTLYAKANGFVHSECHVPVICGHSRTTMVPLLSQASPKTVLPEETCLDLTTSLRDYTIYEKASSPLTPALSIAYSVYLFTQRILEAIDGQISQVNALVENNDFGTSYFSGLVEVNKNGIGEMRLYSDLFSYECGILEQSIRQLREDVTVGKKILEIV
ncbi:Malate dehydrogenase, mitochondrial [Papilio xuthus]|uniref:Malate dehydrogenase, mitochondrial n=1 Tax=Papilio xuthus TaxID=66420 RepID=A0A194Q8N5_PAPXU|nr:Malate dehydrogenase, mitochondrial [Papilio xuthus]